MFDIERLTPFVHNLPPMITSTRELELTNWYDSLSEENQSLYDMIEERCPEFTKSDGEDCQAFMDELAEYGITTAQQFEDSFCYSEDYRPDLSHYSEFVEYLVTEVNCETVPEYLVIDWLASWRRNYRHDFIDIEHDDIVYFFNRNF